MYADSMAIIAARLGHAFSKPFGFHCVSSGSRCGTVFNHHGLERTLTRVVQCCLK